MQAPEFWMAGKADWRSAALTPAAAVYAWATARRMMKTASWSAPFPVISVGNLVAGGAGKTPVALDLCARLRTLKRRPSVVLRGYGGTETGPLRVNASIHSAQAVGDEALLHAQETPTWVAADRRAGVEGAVAAGTDVIVLDDAHQNPAVHSDLKIVVVDGAYGFGNGRVIPAGPLREPVDVGLSRADALVLLGDDDAGALERVPATCPVLRADVVADGDWSGRSVVAFAGIGRPEKVFATLRRAGADVVKTQSFPDHHNYRDADLTELTEHARRSDATVVTTTKDFVRLPLALRDAVETVSVRIKWHDDPAVTRVLSGVL